MPLSFQLSIALDMLHTALASCHCGFAGQQRCTLSESIGVFYLSTSNSIVAVFILGCAGVYLLLQTGVQRQACEVGETAAQRWRHVIVVLQVSKGVHCVVR